MSITERIIREIKLLLKSISSVNFKKITKQQIISELLSNGIAALCAVFVYNLIHNFFHVERNVPYHVKNSLKKILAPDRIKATDISQRDFDWIMDWIGNPLIFIISIIVFSLVEQVMEQYLKDRKKI